MGFGEFCVFAGLAIGLSAVIHRALNSPYAQWEESFFTVAEEKSPRFDSTIHASGDNLTVLLVLGHEANHSENRVSPILAQRVQGAVHLTRVLIASHKPFRVLMSGGSSYEVDETLPSEADIMSDYFLSSLTASFSLSSSLSNRSSLNFSSLLLLEKHSTSTWTNALNSLVLLDGYLQNQLNLKEYSNELKSDNVCIVLITSRFHQWRTLKVFERVLKLIQEQRQLIHLPYFKVQFLLHSAPSNALENSDQNVVFVPRFHLVREVAATALYWILGRI